MLAAQKAYGGGTPIIRDTDDAAFGINLHALLPEDDADRQPLLIDGHLLTADVRLDNRDEIARALGLEKELQAAADSEILLRAWLCWGESCLDRIVGDYAFAIYDVGARKLSLVRDFLGQKPLFYAQTTGLIAFSTMPTGLLALSRFRQGLNYRALALSAADVPDQSEATFFNSIRRVLPGQVVTYTPDGMRTRSHWEPNLEWFELNSAGEYADAYRNVLDKAVRSRLRRRNGPVAAHLSSGLDSSAVAATAARLGHEVIAFTAAPRLGFQTGARRGRCADESEAAAQIAQMHGMRHSIVRTSGSSLSLVRSLVATSQVPTCNILNQDWFWSIERMARDNGASILLTGEYGNSTLNAGGLRVMADWVRTFRWFRWWKEARSAAAQADTHWRGILFNSFEPWLPFPVRRALFRHFLDVQPRSRTVFLKSEWIQILGNDAERAFLTSCPTSFAEARLVALRRWDNGPLLKGSLARHGIDNRSPLGDRRAVEFSLRLPPDQMLSSGVSRPLARRALSDRITEEVLASTLRGYQSADWFENLDPTEIRSLSDEIASSTSASEIIDVGKIRCALANWPSCEGDRFDTYQRLGVDLPNALATGIFVLEAEKWMRGA